MGNVIASGVQIGEATIFDKAAPTRTGALDFVRQGFMIQRRDLIEVVIGFKEQEPMVAIKEGQNTGVSLGQGNDIHLINVGIA